MGRGGRAGRGRAHGGGAAASGPAALAHDPAPNKAGRSLSPPFLGNRKGVNGQLKGARRVGRRLPPQVAKKAGRSEVVALLLAAGARDYEVVRGGWGEGGAPGREQRAGGFQ